jgi:hypothetical protein
LDAYSQPNVALAIWKPTRLLGMDWERAMASRNQNYTFCSASILSNHSNLPSSTPRHRVRKAGRVCRDIRNSESRWNQHTGAPFAASIVKTEETLVNSLHLPRPYEDELLYSVFARYTSYLQPRRGFYEAIFGTRYASIKYGKELDCLARRTYSTWAMSAHEILERHTAYPFYGYYLPTKLHLESVAAFTKPRPVKDISRLLHNSGVPDTERLFSFMAYRSP